MAIEFSEKNLTSNGSFIQRHIGPSESERAEMLKALGFSKMEELTDKALPKSIRSEFTFQLGEGQSEHNLLEELHEKMKKNKVYETLIGIGFHDTATPPVIQRQLLENPAWYTAYTPYQPEISQGRLEALLNFQTMVSDLTGMEIANASMLDEGSATAEAMTMAYALRANKKSNLCFVDQGAHPHVIEVLETRAKPMGIDLKIADVSQFEADAENCFCAIVHYPSSEGIVHNYKDLSEKVHSSKAFLVAVADLLSLTLLKPPGEWGADIVVGNSQRFGVPLGYGGPHAAFFATKEKFKRSMPGRIVGVSVDNRGRTALRLALQTREQHIRRERATSNICTAQVLLANMASMYAVYHGPEGLKDIALRIHQLACMAALGLDRLGFPAKEGPFFDTLKISLNRDQQKEVISRAKAERINLRIYDDGAVGIAFNERSEVSTLEKLFRIFSGEKTVSVDLEKLAKEVSSSLPETLLRTSKYLTHPVFNKHHSETELMRYMQSLAEKDLSLVHSMIPLGSCTMKLNAVAELMPVSWPEANRLHPFCPIDQAEGYQSLIQELEQMLCEITGFAAVSLQPNAGSQGEFAGLLAIKKYHESRGDQSRDICLIPSSAHGTNPASAVMAGMKVVVVQCDDQGNIDLTDLKAKCEQHKKHLSALMITYPSTHGVFEEGIRDICAAVHEAGGQVYMDGANMNAMVGLCRPFDIGADVCHLNLHKTFSIPHGGGGPGVGPIGVASHLAPFVPALKMVPESGPSDSAGTTTSAPWGSASILPISWTYIRLMGSEGLRLATETAILNANYLAKKISDHFPVLYKGKEGLVAHECIIDLRPLKKETGIDVNDIAKRLMDFGFHSPTMSFPVAGTLMIEPTESESKDELDRFADAIIQIRKEADRVASGEWDAQTNPLTMAPHTTADLVDEAWDRPYTRREACFPVAWLNTNKYWCPVNRVDNAYGDRNLMCSCPSIDEYAD